MLPHNPPTPFLATHSVKVNFLVLLVLSLHLHSSPYTWVLYQTLTSILH